MKIPAKIRLSLVVAFLFSSLCFAVPFTEIPGQSLAQKQLSWMWMNRDMLLKSCEFDKAKCSRDPQVARTVLALQKMLRETNETPLYFISEKEKPGFFTSDQGETHRVAVTGYAPKEAIYFNTDLISKLDLNQLSAILFHELTHKLGILDDAQRLPDLVGAAMAGNIRANLAVTPFPLKNGKQIVLAAFRTSTKESLSGPDFNLGAIRGIGYFTDGDLFVDLDMSRFELDSPCKSSDEVIAAQGLMTPLWVQSKDKPNHIEGLVLMNNMCANVKKNTYSMVSRAMRAKIEFSNDGKILRDSVVVGLSDDPMARIEYLSTAELLSAEVPSSVKAGETIEMRLKILNRGELVPNRCEAGYQAVLSGLPTENNGTMMNANDCQIRSLGFDQYEIKLRIPIGPEVTSGKYRIPLIKILGTGGYELVFLKLDDQVHWDVVGGSTLPVLKLGEPKAQLPSLSGVGEYPMKNSYTYSRGQTFEVELSLPSLETFTLKALDLVFLLGMDGKLASAHELTSPQDLSFALKSHRFEKRGSGHVLILQFQLPNKYRQQTDLWGLRLDGITLQNLKTGQAAVYKNSEPYTNMIFLDLIRGLSGL